MAFTARIAFWQDLVLFLADNGAIMQKFEYRGPRFSIDLPVQLTVQNATQAVRCTEISKEGMRVEFGQPLEPNSSGKVSMICEGQMLAFRVRVVHVGDTQAGLEFIYSSEAERNAVAHLVESLTGPGTGRARCF
jgi:hypothetical protein